MLNKKIASELAVGVILILALIVGGIFWMQDKNKIQQTVDSNQRDTKLFQESNINTDDSQKDLKNDELKIASKKIDEKSFLIDKLRFKLPENWIITKEDDGKTYIRDLNYKTNYDVFLYPSEMRKALDGVMTKDYYGDNPIKVNGVEIFEEAIGGAMAGYIVSVDGYDYEIIWDVAGNQPIPADEDGVWRPDSSFNSENVLELMKNISVE